MKVCALFLVFIIIGILCVLLYEDDGTVYEYVNGTKIRVRRRSKYEQVKTANHLYSLRHEFSEFIDYLVKLEAPTREKSLYLKKIYINLAFGETPIKEKQVAYILNKGSEMRICVRDANGNFLNKNQTIFIILHELAHIITSSYDHTEEFLNNQKILVTHARQYGLYKEYKDSDYCGLFLPYIKDL